MDTSHHTVMPNNPMYECSIDKKPVETKKAERVITQDAAMKMARYLEKASGLFFTLILEPCGRMSMPFVAGSVSVLNDLRFDDLAEDIGPFLARCRPDEAAYLVSELHRSARAMAPCRIEFRIFDSSGQPVSVVLTAMPQQEAASSGAVEWNGVVREMLKPSQHASVFSVAAHKHGENAAEDREAFLASLLDTIPLPVFFKDRAGRYLGFNRAFETVFCASKESIGKSVFDTHPRHLAEIYFAKDEELFKAGGVQQYESRLKSSTGEERDVVFNKAVFTDRNGVPLGLIGVVQDITERNQAERAQRAHYEEVLRLNEQLEEGARALEEYAVELEASQEQIKTTEAWYRSILHSAPDGILVVDDNGIITLANRQVSRMFGYSETELLGRSVDMLVPADLRQGHAKKRLAFPKIMTEETASRLVGDQRACRKDGTEFAVDVALSRLPDSDSDAGIICATVRDITERHEAEQKLNEARARLVSVLQTIPDMVWLKDVEGVYLSCNHGFERLTGKPESDIVGKTDYDLFDLKLADLFREKDRAAIEAKHLCLYEEWVTYPDNGEHALMETRKVPVFGVNGDVTGVLGVARDITERKRMESALERREQEFRTLAENAPDIIMRYDRECRRIYVNPAFVNAIGLSYEALLGRTPTQYSSSSNALAYENAIRKVLREGHACEHEYPWVTVSGRSVISLFNIVPERDADGSVESVLAIGRDITERKHMEEILELREREFRTLVENARDTITRYGRDLRRLYVNPAFAALFDGDASSLLGVTPAECPLATTADTYTLNLSEVFASGEAREFELKWNAKDGTEVCHLINLTPEFGADGTVESILAVGRDITELNAFRQKIHQMAFYDPLTSLPNRALFNDRLRQMMADVSWHGQLAGVMLIDMDRFKEVNDTMGHAVGDDLLREAAVRLSSCVRAYDTVARLGGDEFAILLPEVRSGDDLGRIAGKILDKFGERFLLDGKEVFVSCSIGIALYPDDSTEANDLVKYADSAMYFAKRSGRNNFRFYSKDLTDSANERLALESELRRAIERNELELHYQPKVLLQSGEIIGSEALLRWRNPQFGMVSPVQFIPIAEDTGLIIELGEWVLREACQTASEWNAEGRPLHKVAINLSARQFQSQNLAAVVSTILKEKHCRPEWIELEITESLLLDEEGKTLETLSAFQSMGISIAIDDFGTGYSALSYLARFPINTLKIDKSFIHSVTTDKYRSELVKAILSIARCLNQQVVAEGVETLEQAAFLEVNGCHVAQGFLYSRPVPKAEVASMPRRFNL
ncbi:MAG TPA: PAS domain S-box protein [Rhodocyclaceae bacterium]|nr:PAS domain S-box protein [Rhodocyclaceae bacterium]